MTAETSIKSSKISAQPIFDLVRQTVRQIPQGKVSTYGHIAQYLNLKSPRIIGWALRGNQDKTLACHRVVRGDGTLAPQFSLGGSAEQQRRLENDGLIFSQPCKVDMEKYFFSFSNK